MPITKGQGNPNWSTEETLLALDLLLKHAPAIPDKNHPEVKRLSDLLRTLPIHPSESRNDRFRNPAGVSMKLQNLNACKTGRGLSTSKVDRAVWDNFGTEPESVRKIAVAIEDGAYLLQEQNDELPGVDDNETYNEGTLLTKVHKVRERARGYRKKVLNRSKKLTGVVSCEGCGTEGPKILDSSAREAMFEVHHLVPLSEAVSTKTRLSDLALLCANCHKLIHAISKRKKYAVTIEEFRLEITD